MNKIEKFKEWWDSSYEKVEGYHVYLYYDDTCPDLRPRYSDNENHITAYTSDDWGEVCICGFLYSELEPILYPNNYKQESKPLDLCPICEYDLDHCQCLFSGSTHPDRDDRRKVVLDHLYLFNDKQINHIKEMQRLQQISYDNEHLNTILEELKKTSSN